MANQTQETAMLSRLAADLEALPAQAGRVAREILADPFGVARLTIGELAGRAGTSEASVTRLAQRVGLDGFPELRIALAVEAARSTSRAPERVTSDIELGDDPATVKGKVLHGLEQSLRETAAVLDDGEVGRVAEAVVGARRTLVLGIGASGVVASDLARKLERIGLITSALTEHHDAVTTCVASRPGDVVIGISHSGETLDLVDPVARAVAAGATGVALTSRRASTLARTCDHLLQTVASTEDAMRPAAMNSRSAQLFVIDVLFVAVVQRDYDRAQPLLDASWEATSPRHPERARRAR